MDKFTKKDMSCNNKVYQFPPDQFFLSAAPFDPTYQTSIQKVHESCVSQGYFVRGASSGEWQVENVPVLDQDDVVIPNPSREQRWAELFNEVSCFNNHHLLYAHPRGNRYLSLLARSPVIAGLHSRISTRGGHTILV